MITFGWLRRKLFGKKDEPFLCPQREQAMPMQLSLAGPNDHWREQRDGTRTCSYCGSLHPDDFADICYGYVRGPEFHFEPTSKGYKVYANKPGVKNASEGGIKFYGWHGTDAADAAYKLALPVYRRRLKERWGNA